MFISLFGEFILKKKCITKERGIMTSKVVFKLQFLCMFLMLSGPNEATQKNAS